MPPVGGLFIGIAVAATLIAANPSIAIDSSRMCMVEESSGITRMLVLFAKGAGGLLLETNHVQVSCDEKRVLASTLPVAKIAPCGVQAADAIVLAYDQSIADMLWSEEDAVCNVQLFSQTSSETTIKSSDNVERSQSSQRLEEWALDATATFFPPSSSSDEADLSAQSTTTSLGNSVSKALMTFLEVQNDLRRPEVEVARIKEYSKHTHVLSDAMNVTREKLHKVLSDVQRNAGKHTALPVVSLDSVASFLEMTAGLQTSSRANANAHAVRLFSMLVEVDSKTKSLLRAGVTSKEIFACVVDSIMNMAPEIIVQIIVATVRDVIVMLLGMVLAMIMPYLLVPNSGAIGVAAPNPSRTVPRMGPPAAPCECRDENGDVYTPQFSFLEMLAQPHECSCVPNADARFASAEAQTSAFANLHTDAWFQHSLYAGSGKGGPIAHILPKVKEAIDDSLRSGALPRLQAAVSEQLSQDLPDILESSLHIGISRKLINSMTRSLTTSIVKKTGLRIAAPLAKRVSADISRAITAPLSNSLSVSIAHSLSQHPGADYMCAYCQHFNGTVLLHPWLHDVRDKQLPESPDGMLAYCSTCYASRAHDKLLDAQIFERLQHGTSTHNHYYR